MAKKTAAKKQYVLPTEDSPLENGKNVSFKNEVEHAFFLRCWEIYRLISLIIRRKNEMIHFFSMFRDNKQFADVFALRRLNFDEFQSAKFDPELNALAMVLFDTLNELRIYVSYTDQLPLTVQHELEITMVLIRKNWNCLAKLTEKKYGWAMKQF